MLQNKTNIKNILESNAINKMNQFVFSKMKQIDDKLSKKIGLFILGLKQGRNPEYIVSNKNYELEELKEFRKELTKSNYHFPDIISVGEAIALKEMYSKIIPEDKRQFVTKTPFYLPLNKSGIAFLLNSKYADRINNLLEINVLDLISALPDGLVKVTLIDKSGSGQNIPILSGLHEKFIEGKVLSTDKEIEDELEEIRHSMSAIAQSISANGFDSVEDYNLRTDEVPQRYNFVVIVGFPNGFSKKSVENLASLVDSGSKSGIYIFMSLNYNPIYGLNQTVGGLTLNQIIAKMSVLEFSNKPHPLLNAGVIEENVDILKVPLKSENDFRELYNTKFKISLKKEDKYDLKKKVNYFNEQIKDLNLRPVIDIEKVYPNKDEFWTKQAGLGVCVPFGKKGIENVYIALGINQYGEVEGTHHGMVGGATGSGKTVLIHDIILMLSMFYSPREVQFYLLDYKEGTEFAVYKDFPHVQILSMESEIEFGHEVLDKAISIMEQRGKLFKEVGAANLFTYNNNVPEEKKLPRIIIFIDEFQALLPKDQRISSKTNERLDRILRLGRSFGINLMLATQTLKGVDLDPAILSNMPLRIALKMDEKDASKLFTEDNTAPKYLKYPGEGIYNKDYGNSKANVHFQAYKCIGDTVFNTMQMVLDYMNENMPKEDIKQLFDSRFVYNGETESKLENNIHYLELLKKNECSKKIYLGEPAGLSKEHLHVQFKDDFGENLLILGGDQTKAASLYMSIIKQIVNLQKEKAFVFFLNFNRQLKDKFYSYLKENNLSQKITYEENRGASAILEEIYKEYKTRANKENPDISEKIYLFMYYIESAKLFTGGYSSPDIKKILELLNNGPEYGVHLVFYATDFTTLSNLDLTRELSKFKKKIALKSSNSLKIFGLDSGVKFSKSNNTAIIDTGEIGSELKKIKPYIIDVFKIDN